MFLVPGLGIEPTLIAYETTREAILLPGLYAAILKQQTKWCKADFVC